MDRRCSVERSVVHVEFVIGEALGIQRIRKSLAERSFDLRTSGLWAQHASTAPLC